jgi:hypothetical protein
MLLLFDYFLLVIHTLVVIFNLTGWFWQATRKWHFLLISLTMFSWFALGPFYGWGYCPLTDWHWQIKYDLGQTDLPASWIKYYVDYVTGGDSNRLYIDIIVVVLGLSAWIISAVLNWKARYED